MDRLKILLVPDYFNWILGTWAKQIVKMGSQHDYYFFPQQMLLRVWGECSLQMIPDCYII